MSCSADRRSQSKHFDPIPPHCPKNYLNLSIKTKPDTDGADADADVWLSDNTVASAPTVKHSVCMSTFGLIFVAVVVVVVVSC